ncbi:uncharacterized protein LOC129586138 [Paramacrobiotus metropolitanus]|uniref:uncharacterized protein LOC129586138 n=1 Tax=Paramacrobiotus metropolitanus TaxID=2943436 RepID=UPI002445DE2B|nr:uncharacterized protein LOC129586138 [Paramacrobiotus metropolitanus]XP_055335140.1 uncharacterized protein LOC129586138 [Paramacrobiotus metropolitanus]XP_055335141.1 uncharacterized protein LOC129586138 [Paramacrobiotus metropolitanus]XP_055335142.1 uncharacterized protein LOC129586138 [Paramacrobiotus metropolitanus]XP_055335143.1 uncharacterized protein LOC129586138 [Paramacrobiotus metropolitanus]
MSLYPTATIVKSGGIPASNNIAGHNGATGSQQPIPAAPATNVLTAQNPTTSNKHLSPASTSSEWPTGKTGSGKLKAAPQHRASIFDSFVTVKNSLRSPQLGVDQMEVAENVTRSRSFVVTRDRLTRSRSDDISELDDQPDDSSASVTDVRVHIQRENSLLSIGTITPRIPGQPRTPSGSIAYVAWEDHDSTSTVATSQPPLKIWTEEALLQFGQTAYHDENLSQITDYLYIGDIYAANNDHLMCRLNIDAIVDMSNLRPADVRKLKACHIPCTCPISTNHQRAKLILGVKNQESEDIHLYFDEINRFIESIRRSGRKVLVHSVRGQGRSAVAVIQYLMQVHRLNMQAAFRVTKLARVLKINPGFRETLEFLESQLRREGKLPPAERKHRLAPRLIV